MSGYPCGCSAAGEERCPAHEGWACHYGPDDRGGECPPCKRNRWLSVGATRAATPTRTFRPSRETKELEGVR